MRSLGIDVTIDYTRTRFEAAVADVDVVLDLVGGDTALRSLAVLRPGGLHIAIAGDAEPALVEAGRLRVEVQTALPLAQAAKAHELGETGGTRGKIVLEVAS